MGGHCFPGGRPLLSRLKAIASQVGGHCFPGWRPLLPRLEATAFQVGGNCFLGWRSLLSRLEAIVLGSAIAGVVKAVLSTCDSNHTPREFPEGGYDGVTMCPVATSDHGP